MERLIFTKVCGSIQHGSKKPINYEAQLNGYRIYRYKNENAELLRVLKLRENSTKLSAKSAFVRLRQDYRQSPIYPFS